MGGGIAGAINYLTLAPTRDLTQARLAIGSDTYISGDLRFGRAAGRHQMIAAATGLFSEGWRDHNERKVGNAFFKDVVRMGQASALAVGPSTASSASDAVSINVTTWRVAARD
jgi:hypothetical protein